MATNFPGLKWSYEKGLSNKAAEQFSVIARYALDKKGQPKVREDEDGRPIRDKNGKELLEHAKSSHTRTLTGIPKYLKDNPGKIYIADVDGIPYWITGSENDIRAALALAGVRNIDHVINNAITARNYKDYYINNSQTLVDYIESKQRVRSVVNIEKLTSVKPYELGLLVKSRNRATVRSGTVVRIDKKGKQLKSTSGSGSPRRQPITPEKLLDKANTCKNKIGFIPVKDEKGTWVIPQEGSRQAVNIGKMTADGKGTKSCYVPRDNDPSSGRRKARKLVHIDVQLDNRSNVSTNIMVNVDNENSLENYISFMKDLLTDSDITRIRNRFKEARGELYISSPRKRGKKRSGTVKLRGSPGRRSPKKVKTTKGGNVRYVPDVFNRKEVKSLSSSDYSSSDDEGVEELTPVTITPTPIPTTTTSSPRSRQSSGRTSSSPRGGRSPASQSAQGNVGGEGVSTGRAQGGASRPGLGTGMTRRR